MMYKSKADRVKENQEQLLRTCDSDEVEVIELRVTENHMYTVERLKRCH